MGTERPGIGADLSPALVGRERELERLLALVNGIQDHGGALVIRGEAGIGKSALLAAASARARGQRVRVSRTTAVASEARPPFAALHELLLPFLDRLDGLPEVQRHALEMALGLAMFFSPSLTALIGRRAWWPGRAGTTAVSRTGTSAGGGA